MFRVLILGGSGLIGKAIVAEMQKSRDFEVFKTYFQNQALLNQDRNFKMNIEDLDDINNILNIIKPDYVVSCLRGDFSKQLALHIKTAQYLSKTGGRLYFFSTTNVFDNDLSRPHDEDDLPNSQSDYGIYKIECEKKITEILCENVCILRIPQVWGKSSPRIKELLNCIHNNTEIIVYPNLFLNTNTDVMIAKQLCYIFRNNLKGIFHLVSKDIVNYKEFHKVLISGLGFKDYRLKDSFDAEGFFSLLSKRIAEFPEDLRFTNKSVVNYLIKEVNTKDLTT